MLIWAPELWPWTARQWYNRYGAQFWQEGGLLAGYREFPRDVDIGWFNLSDVDAGPVIGGYGVAACAFGVGATRAMGDLDCAGKLAAEAMVVCWPLPDGTLLVPRILSNLSDAPYLGEAATLFALTRRPAMPAVMGRDARLPGAVYVGIACLLSLGFYEIVASVRKLRRWHRDPAGRRVPLASLQAGAWGVLLGASVVSWFAWSRWPAVVFVLAALVLPVQRKRPRAKTSRTSP